MLLYISEQGRLTGVPRGSLRLFQIAMLGSRLSAPPDYVVADLGPHSTRIVLDRITSIHNPLGGLIRREGIIDNNTLVAERI